MPLFRDPGSIADGIYLIDTHIWGIARQHAVYLLYSLGKAALIDTGIRKTMSYILDVLNRLQIKQLDYILITHSHPDHSGAVLHFAKKFPMAKIGFPERASEIINTFYHKAVKYALPNPIIKLKENDSIVLNSEFVLKVLETPGHSPDHISYYEPHQKILFVGDACGAHHLGMNFSRPTAYAPDFQHKSYINTLRRFQDLCPNGLAIASYGFATGSDALACIATAIQDYQNWTQVIRNAWQKTPSEEYVAEILLNTFGRSPGEIRENRPNQWVRGIMRGIARGFLHSWIDALKDRGE
ncbi:MAG: MBL fold metallo-hydrolase [Candidatus Helarchaeota archaeon]